MAHYDTANNSYSMQNWYLKNRLVRCPSVCFYSGAVVRVTTTLYAKDYLFF